MTAQSARIPQSANRILFALTSGHLFNDFYSTILPFLLPVIIDTFEIGFGGAGILALSTSLFSSFMQPVVGHLADKYQRRKLTILIGFMLFALGMILAGFAKSFVALILAFFVYGLGQTTYHPQATHFITSNFKTTKGRAMGIHGIGGSLGNFSAPLAVTALLTVLSLQTSLFLLALPTLLITVIMALSLRESTPMTSNKGRFQISRELLLLSVTFGLLFMLFRGFLTFLPTLLVERGSTLTQAGSISALMFFVGFLSQPLGGALYDRVGGRVVMAISSALAAGSLWLFLQESWPHPLLYVVLIGAAVTATFPVALTTASVVSPPESVGMSVGVMFGVSAGMGALTPPLVGFLGDRIGLESAFLVLIVFGAAAFLLSFRMPTGK